MAGPDYVLSDHEFDVLWTELGLGRIPRPLEVPRCGTPRERMLVTAEVRRGLRADGLIARDGSVDGALAAMLRLLAGRQVMVDLVGYFGYQVRALSATDGRSQVLATQAGAEVWLSRPADLAAAIVGVLPAAVPSRCPPSGSLAVPIPGELAGTWRGGGRFGFATAGCRPVTCFATDNCWYLVTPDELGVEPADLADIQRRIGRVLSTLYKA